MALKITIVPNGSTQPSHTRYLLWFVVAVVLVVVLFFALQPSEVAVDEVATSEVKTKAPDREVRIPHEVVPAKSVVEAQNEMPPQRVGEIRDGYRLMLNGELRKVRGVVTINAASDDPIAKIFSEPADQLIAGLLLVEPGDSLIGESEDYFTDFVEQFKQSLTTAIKIEPDDDELTKELKNAVMMSREELKDAMAQGEDLVELMTTTRKQFQELGLYRDDLKTLVEASLEDGDFSAQDYEALVKTANEMLNERGVKELEFPKLFQHYALIQGLDHPEVDPDAVLEEEE